MSIKMIAVDMDGTFLNDQKEYNRERFEKLFQQLKKIASGLLSLAAINTIN